MKQVLAVVGNKIDKAEQEAVSYNQAKQYAESVKAVLKLTSAKDGKGINELFTTIAQKFEEQKTALTNKGKPADRSSVPLAGQNGGKQKKSCCGGKEK